VDFEHELCAAKNANSSLSCLLYSNEITLVYQGKGLKRPFHFPGGRQTTHKKASRGERTSGAIVGPTMVRPFMYRGVKAMTIGRKPYSLYESVEEDILPERKETNSSFHTSVRCSSRGLVCAMSCREGWLSLKEDRQRKSEGDLRTYVYLVSFSADRLLS